MNSTEGTATPGTAVSGPAASGSASNAGDQGFIAVREIPNLDLPTAQVSEVKLPPDTFKHATQSGGFQLTARLSNGLPLPSWVQFDSDTGIFTLQPPRGISAQLHVIVTARDRAGRTASAGMELNVK
jgi:hypothetical protein